MTGVHSREGLFTSWSGEKEQEEERESHSPLLELTPSDLHSSHLVQPLKCFPKVLHWGQPFTT